MNRIFVIIMILLGIFYGFPFLAEVFFLSLLFALLPFRRTWFWFLLPIIIEIILYATGHSKLANWTLVFIPFHYTAFMANTVRLIRGIWDMD